MKETDSHEWVKLEGNVATVGLTAHGAKEVGEVVFVALPKLGTTLTLGQEASVIESTKAAIDTYAPMSGVIFEVNPALQHDPGLVTKDPYGKGWLYKLTIADRTEYDTYLDHPPKKI